MAQWQPVQAAAKDASGNYVALINGQWVPVSGAAKNEQGQYMAVMEPQHQPEPTLPQYEKTAEEMPFGEQVLAGLGGGLAGMGLGARQIASGAVGDVSRGLGKLPGIFGPISRGAGQLAEYVSPTVTPPEQEVQEYQKAMSELRGTAGGFIGEVGSYIVPGTAAMKGVTAVPKVAGMLGKGGLTAAGAVAGTGGVVGAGQSALIPVTEKESRLANVAMGSAVSAVAPAAIGGIIKGLEIVTKPIYEAIVPGAIRTKAGTIMAEAAGRKSATEVGEDYKKVIEQLQKTPEGVISPQTAGQAAIEAEVPTFSALQKISEAYKSIPASKLETIQETGRVNALQTITGGRTEEAKKLALSAAEKAREKAATNLYGKAFAADDMRLNAVKTKLERTKGGIGQAPTAELPVDPKIAPLQSNEILADAAKQIMRETNQYGNPFTNLRGLDYMKKMIDSDIAAIKTGRQTSLKSVNESQLYSAKAQLLSAMEDLSPSYRSAREKYAEMSLPINRMEVGKVLEDALTSPLAGAERGTAFANKIRAAKEIIKKKTGQERYNSLDKLFDERQMKVIKNVLNELEINEKVLSQSKKGMTEQARKMGMEPVKAPHSMSRVTTYINDLINRVSGDVKNRTITQIADAMQDPKFAAYLMGQATDKEKNAIKMLVAYQKSAATIAPSVYKGTE